MTAIQNACIHHAVAVRDILGAALTGSGKTFAFVNPMLKCLYCNQIQPSDGPDAVVLSPTWELAVQIFEMVRVVGAYNRLSARLLVGGKKEFYLEQRHMGWTKIFIATLGRLLQHLEQSPNLDTLQVIVIVLVLNEADCAEEKDQILEKHPKRRLLKRGKKDNNEAQGEAATLTLGDVGDSKGELEARGKVNITRMRARMRRISKRRRTSLLQ
jgi:ATP-dependent RNA helicase DDX10/DBP4